jgi:hypothetical protein
VRPLVPSFSPSRLQKGTTSLYPSRVSDVRDFWRALKERHPFALSIARGPKKPRTSATPTSNPNKLSLSLGFPLGKLPPILPSRLRLSFLNRQSSTPLTPQPLIGTTAVTPTASSSPPIQLPELAFRRTDLENPYHTFPRSQLSPRIYLHSPQWEIDGTPPPSSATRDTHRYSLPNTVVPSPLGVNSAMHMPVSVSGSSVVSSARISLLSVATDSLALGSKLESCVDE